MALLSCPAANRAVKLFQEEDEDEEETGGEGQESRGAANRGTQQGGWVV